MTTTLTANSHGRQRRPQWCCSRTPAEHFHCSAVPGQSPSLVSMPPNPDSAATAGLASENVSILDGIGNAAGPGSQIRFAPGPGRFPAAPVVVPREFFTLREGGPGIHGEYFDNNRTGWAAPPDENRPAGRLPLDAQLARARHSVRLVLGKMDRNASGSHRRRQADRHRGERWLSTVDRQPAPDR